MMKIRFADGMRERPIRDSRIRFFDYGTQCDGQLCIQQSWNAIEIDDGIQLQQAAVAMNGDARRLCRFDIRHAIAIPAKFVHRPLTGWREVELDITVRVRLAHEGFETRVPPQSIGPVGKSRWGYHEALDVALDSIAKLEAGARSACVNADALDSGTGCSRVTEELDVGRDHARGGGSRHEDIVAVARGEAWR